MIWWRRASRPSFPIDRLEACPTILCQVPPDNLYEDKTFKNYYKRLRNRKTKRAIHGIDAQQLDGSLQKGSITKMIGKEVLLKNNKEH